MHEQRDINIDFALLVPTLIMSEALIRDYRLKKSLILLLDHVIKKEPNLGKEGLIDWLTRTQFSHVEDVKKILRTTPLGNPAWGLLNYSPTENKKLISDLDKYIKSTTEIKSLKSLAQAFIAENPQYGVLTDIDLKKCSTFYVSNRWQAVGDVTTRLMLLQMVATPRTKRQLLLEGYKDVESDDYPIHRPDPILYKIALRDLLIGTASCSQEVWDEMVSLYMTRSLTNFLSFAPLLLQPFITSDFNIPVPSINTLATLMGDFTGATGSFMGEITRSGMSVSWPILCLTLGKLCEKTSTLPEVTRYTAKEDSRLDCSLQNTYKVCGDISETPTLGKDQGWIVLGEESLEDRWNISLTDISNSISKNIKFNKFPMARRSLVFNTSNSLTCLDSWSIKQVEQSKVWRLLGVLGGLPSSRDLITNSYTVFPRLTYIIRLERKSLKSLRKNLPRSACEAEAKTETCVASGFKDEDRPNVASNRCAFASEEFNRRQQVSRNFGKSTLVCPHSDGVMFRFFIAETYQEERYKKECISKLRQEKLVNLKRDHKDVYSLMKDEDLTSLISQSLPLISKLKTITDEDRIKIGEVELMFAALIERNLGIEFPNLVGLRKEKDIIDSGNNPLHFRYALGDEEATAVEAWFNDNEEDYLPAEPATKAVHRINVALTFIYLTQYLHKQGNQWDFDKLWQFELFKKYPLRDEDKQAVYSLIPILYWVYVLRQQDACRISKPDMTTELFVPTARITHSIYEEKHDDISDKYLPEPLDNVRVATLSLCSLKDWKPENILTNISIFFDSVYSHEKHPNETKYIRLYVKLAVTTLLKRFSNINLAYYVSCISSIKMDLDSVITIFKTCRESISAWYNEFSTSFSNKWTLIGNEWMMFDNLDEKEEHVSYV